MGDAPVTARIARLEAMAHIKALQHRYGFLLAAQRWDEASRLFVDDGTLQIGDDGTYRGRARIAEYLRTTFGRTGDGVDAHLQLMPVITVAPDGRSARATWRELGTGGGVGSPAYWSEGPQENRYELTGEGWRIRALHWQRALHVPYDGGWPAHVTETPPAGIAPDAPASSAQPVWPDPAPPAFHFFDARGRVLLDTPAWAADGAEPALSATDDARLRRLEDLREIENLQGMLGYYVDKGQWTHAIACFDADGEVVLPDGGVHTGRDGIERLLRSFGPEGAIAGRLLDTMTIQPDLELAPGTDEATGRWRLFLQWGAAGRVHELGLGIAHVRYTRTPRGWRVRRLELTDCVFTPYDQGWDRARAPHSAIHAAFSADGEPGPPAEGPPDAAELTTMRGGERTDVESRLRRVETAQQVERIQHIYGYCLATFEWDHLASLFAEDGTIEVAMRGVYRGRESVRRSLDLYGSEFEYGVLHNHMQFQPVIHVAPDAGSATLRSRAFSMMGQFGEAGRWMGGVYDNRYGRIGDDMHLTVGRLVNTYFAPYDAGWKDLPLRPAPGVSEALPPDAPPSLPFEMYPAAQPTDFPYPAPS